MAYDGKLLRRAQVKYEDDRSRHEEEMARRRRPSSSASPGSGTSTGS